MSRYPFNHNFKLCSSFIHMKESLHTTKIIAYFSQICHVDPTTCCLIRQQEHQMACWPHERPPNLSRPHTVSRLQWRVREFGNASHTQTETWNWCQWANAYLCGELWGWTLVATATDIWQTVCVLRYWHFAMANIVNSAPCWCWDYGKDRCKLKTMTVDALMKAFQLKRDAKIHCHSPPLPHVAFWPHVARSCTQYLEAKNFPVLAWPSFWPHVTHWECLGCSGLMCTTAHSSSCQNPAVNFLSFVKIKVHIVHQYLDNLHLSGVGILLAEVLTNRILTNVCSKFEKNRLSLLCA